MPYNVSAFGLSDIGLVRQNNEDFWAFLPKWNLFVLADGMGGHRAGEVAAREATQTFCRMMKKYLEKHSRPTKEEAYEALQVAIQKTNRMIFKLGRSDPDLRGMGTTLCCLFFHPRGLVYAHVGDSRIYRLRDHKLSQLTEDHSLLRELMNIGVVSEKQSVDFIYKNIITKAIGTEPTIEPSVHIAEVQDQDLYFMCTDGLTDMLNTNEIETILNQMPQIEAAVNELINSAKQKGGSDNITVVLTKVEIIHETKDLSR